MTDHFAALGVPRGFRIDPRELERRYLARSRELHPDHQRPATSEQESAIMSNAAALNNAYKTLKDPFDRAEHLVELLAPDAMEQEKRLPPDFLAEVMDLSESVMECDASEAGVRARDLQATIDDYLARIDSAFADGVTAASARTVAGLLHRSRYYRKAQEDLAHKAQD